MKSKVLALILMWVSIFAFSQITQNEIPEKKSDLTSGWEKNQLFTNQKGLTNNKPDSVNIQYINGTDRNIPGSNPAALMKNPMDQSDNSMPAESQCQSNNQQFITSPAGWSGFSSFVIPGELSVEELFSPYSDQLIILYNLLGTYFPSQQVNTIGNWDPSSGYIAKFSEETNIDFSGQIIQNRRIELVSGWNLIPVLSTCPADVAVLFQNKNVRLVKEVSGYRLYWPEMAINTLDELIPGSAYYVLMSGPGQILFPNCGSQIWQCGDNLVDERDGQSYNTVQIGTQCWMAENLNIGAMIPATQAQSDNSVFEKYCYNGTQDSCNVYGGLYQWDEMMQYDTIAGRRGICPSGWHLPTDEEWKVLEGIVDSQFGYPDAEWNSTGFRGYDAGKNLKSENRWLQNGFGVDLFGFNVLPGGNVSNEGLYDNLGAWADFWTSNRLPYGGVSRDLGFSSDESWRDFVPTSYAFSVRCIQNTEPQTWSCGDPIIDTRDNQSYNTVQIGDQCWMAENLNVGTMTAPFGESNNGIIEKSCYDDNPVNCDEYGGLYFWDEIMNYTNGELNQGICPDGWHIPSRGQWDELILYLGGTTIAGGKLKETGYQHWDEPNTGATNASGFTAYGGGLGAGGGYDGFKQSVLFWTSSKIGVEPVLEFLWNQSGEVYFGSAEPIIHYYGSLRCIKTLCPVITMANAGPDQLNAGGDRVLLEANGPGSSLETGTWSIIQGENYSFDNTNDPHSGFSGNPGESYLIAWTISNYCGESDVDTLMVSFVPAPVSYCGSLTELEYQGQVYHTVQIGDQCWLKENMNVGQMIDVNSAQTDNNVIEKYCYNNEPDSCAEYGGLYQWNELMQYSFQPITQGICPEGWRIATDFDWCMLASSLDTAVDCYSQENNYSLTAGDKLKEAGFEHWNNNTNSTNESGFSALGGGYSGMYGTGFFTGIKAMAIFATSTRLSESLSRALTMFSVNPVLSKGQHPNSSGQSVRCIKESEPISWSCGDPLLDTRDNQSYNTVQIGTQCWMAENLNTGTMTAPYEESDNGIIEKLCYEDNSANCDEYGGLYFWEEMMEYSTNEFIQGICPAGWRIPSASDWDTLILSQGGAGIAGGNLKETGFDHWDSPNTGATNQSGFTALGGGLYYWGYFGLKQMGYFWTSSFFLNYGFNPQYRVLFHNNKQVSLNYSDPEVHQYSSVRCIKSQCPEIITANAGNDQINVPGNSTILEANAPSHAVESGKWSVLQGTDGSFYDDTDPHSSFSGNPGATYSLAWTISNLCEKSTTDTILISFAPAPVSFCGDVTEFTYEGQVYHTVQIGDQCWLKENLNVGQMIDGSIMQSDNGILEKHCFNNEPDSCTEYGGIYQWDELMQYSLQQNNQGICPEGWRIPTDFDWCMLGGFLDPMVNCNDPEDTYSDMAGGKLKETGYQHWNIPNEGATNESGFTARGGGFSYGYDFVIFNNIREKGLFSTTTRLNENLIRIISLTANQTTLSKGIIDTNYGISVRCIKESEPPVWGCGDPLLDTRDNQSYNTVQIGTQCWMAENLNTGTMTNPYEQSNNGIIEKLCYGNNSSNCDEYGGLYEWNEMMQYSTSEINQGICPDGWRVPSLSEMDVLVSKLGGESIAGGRLKEPGYIHWNSPNTGATNESGFSAFGAGYFSDGYYGLQQFGSSWTSTMYGGAIPVFKQLTHNSGSIITVPAEPEWYLYISLRCIKSQCPVITTANAGADQLNVAGNSTILDANQPPNLEELGGWTIVAGNNGSFYDASNAHTAFAGEPGETYTLAWTISNLCNETNRDEVNISFATPATSICGNITDLTYEGQVYHTIQIGNQCWLKENINAGQMIEGNIPQTNNNVPEKYCYNNEPDSCTEYGGLYQWNELMQYSVQPGAQGICPEGWHMPTSNDFCILATFLDPAAECNNSNGIISETAGGKLKETGFDHWDQPNEGATNETGFTALGAGTHNINFEALRWYGGFATSTRMTEEYYYRNYMVSVQAHLRKQPATLSDAVSVRCIKNPEPPIWSCGDPLIDTRDNQSYNTVQIGDQCWMAENLNVGTKINTSQQGYQQMDNDNIEKYCYDNNEAYCDIYGGLYEWTEAMHYVTTEGAQGICPEGWHVPSDQEYIILSNFLGESAGGQMKSAGTIEQGSGLWYEPNEGATNSSGFTGLPGSDEYFSNIGYNGNFWSSTQMNYNMALYRYLDYESDTLDQLNLNKSVGLSVRCIKGCWPEPTQANAGPDQLNVPGTSVSLAANTPVFSTGLWAIISGIDGIIVNPSDPESEFKGLAGNEYTLSWTITTQCGSTEDLTVISFEQFSCGEDLKYDGQSYNTLQIGEQCWMAENLNVGNMISGSLYSINNGVIEKYCYDNDITNCNTYGGLYEWGEAMQYRSSEGTTGICPYGWHIPTNMDWAKLANLFGGNNLAGGAMKSTGNLQVGTGLWQKPNNGATNSSGFTGLPAGRRYDEPLIFVHKSYYAFFWSSSSSAFLNPFSHMLSYSDDNILQQEQSSHNGFSIRCLKDCEPRPTQSNAGPNQINVPGITTTLNGNTPLTGTGSWQVISGIGGIIADTLNPHSPFQGLPANGYHLTWTISNECGKSVDTVIITFAQIPVPACPDIPTFIYEGKTYNTVKIGIQCWMKENLDVGTMIPGNSGGQLQTNNGIIEKYCYYSNFTPHCDTYGGLYEWDEAMQYVTEEGSQGICPSGWHIPSGWDWLILTEHLGGAENAGGKMKTMGTLEAGTGLWHDPNSGASNLSGFSGLPVGIREAYNGYFINENYWAYFWSSSQKDAGNAWGQNLDYDATWLKRNNQVKNAGYAVRCIKDCNNPPTQSSAGPDQLNLINTSTVLAANTPSSGTGNWHLESGTGGTIADTLNPVSEFQGLAGSVYSLIWTISTDCGISKDTVIISFAEITSACPGQPAVFYEGQTYNTVQIGSQCWLKENLNVGTRIDGSANPSNNDTIEKYCFDNAEANCEVYGGLYTWNEMMQYTSTEGVQGICPPGWHIPTQAQTIMLSNTLGGVEQAGGKMKSPGTIESGSGLWYAPNTDATNESNFTGFPGGFKQYYSIDFDGDGYFGYFWTSSQKNSGYAWGKSLQYLSGDVTSGANDKNYGFSVRCLRDCSPEPTQAYAGPDQRNIPGTATALTGNIPLAGTGEWNLVNGIGGNIADVYSPTSEFSGLTSNSYTLTWSINTVCGTSVDTVVISFSTVPSCPGIPFLSYEGQVYHTAQIGSQCWLKENLNVGTMINSSQGGQLQTDNGLIEKYCYENSATNCEIYGGLYEWSEAMQYVNSPGAMGICPHGWHIATDDDWTVLSNFLGGSGVAGGKLKSTGIFEAGTGLWKSPNAGGTNSSGFTGYPGGDRYSTNGSFQGLNYSGYFWTSTAKDELTAWYRDVVYGYPDLWSLSYSKAGGFSIRCLKD